MRLGRDAFQGTIERAMGECRCLRATSIAAGLALGLSLVALVVGQAPIARADGDPASDILLFADYSLPYSQPVSDAYRQRLEELTAKARRAHYPVKIAIISSALDLGSDDRFTGRPSDYVRFLSSELASPKSYTRDPSSKKAADIRVPVLVVMPEGVALARRGKPLSTAGVGKIEAPKGEGADPLVETAVVAVQRLAARAGNPIEGLGPAPPSTANASGDTVSQTSSNSDGGTSGWAVAGLVAGGLALIGAAIAGFVFVSGRRRV
jgi:hypothetical protein